MTAAIEARGLGKKYGRRWALSDCTLSIPAGRVVGLVGPNGAGKTTLINLATGMLAADHRQHRGARGAARPAVQTSWPGSATLPRTLPTYSGLSVDDHLRLGAHMNPGWDADLARLRVQSART